MRNNNFITISVSDIHFGAKDSTILLHELDETFIKTVDKMIPMGLDLVVINGDLIHKKLNFNSKTTRELISFMERLANTCTRNNVFLRIVQGTYSHDIDQLRNFEFLNDNHLVKIIYKVESEEIKDHRMLFIPEEYMKNQKEFYKEFFDAGQKDPYDMIFLHGTFKFVAFSSQQSLSEKHISTAPIFDEKQFIDMCHGPILAGHIHVPQNYKNRIYYGGSYTRTSYGEEQPKGFLLSLYNKDENKFMVKFIENKLAPTYNTFDLSNIKEENLLDHISELRYKYDNVRIKNVPKTNLLKQIDTKNMNLDVMVKKDKTEIEVDSKWEFITNGDMLLNNELQEYIKIKIGKIIPLDVINGILND